MELESMTDGKAKERKRKCSSCGAEPPQPTIDISIPGLNKLVDKSYPKIPKMIWLVIIVVSISFGIYMTVYQLKKYFNYPVSSRTYVERKDKIQFPPFSICAFYDVEKDTDGYRKVLGDEIVQRCKQKNMQNCVTNYRDIKLQDLDINLDDIWNRCHFDSVDVDIENVQTSTNSAGSGSVNTQQHSPLGSCSLIRHTEYIPYFSGLTAMEVTIKNSAKTEIIFIPHGESESTVSAFDIFSHELENVVGGTTTTLKITDEHFTLVNKSDNLCYDYNQERENIKQHALYVLSKIDSCRLPFLPKSLPECQTYNDVSRSITNTWATTLELWRAVNLSGRRVCKRKNYALSVDYVLPNNQSNTSITETLLVIKFTADTIVFSEQYFSYDFPALVSDLFAYWGFFICLSAFVYVEIFEFFIRKIYHLCVHAKREI